MTVKDFWHLKYGTKVINHYAGWTGTVINRQLYDEISGMIISRYHTEELKTGRKLLEITFNLDGCKYCRYLQSNRPDMIKHLEVIGNDNLEGETK